MKKMNFYLSSILLIFSGLIFLFCGAANAATTYNGAWLSNDGDVQFSYLQCTEESPDANFFITNESQTNFTYITLEAFQGTTKEIDKFWLGYQNSNGDNVFEYSLREIEAGKTYQVTFDDKIITMSDAAPVPLPASAWLLGGALLGLVGLRSQRKRAGWEG